MCEKRPGPFYENALGCKGLGKDKAQKKTCIYRNSFVPFVLCECVKKGFSQTVTDILQNALGTGGLQQPDSGESFRKLECADCRNY